MPEDPVEFTESVANMIKKLSPHRDIEITGDMALSVDGRRLDLTNLARSVRLDPSKGYETATRYTQIFDSGASPDLNYLSREGLLIRMLPRIHPISFFDGVNKEECAHEDFVNDTVVVYCCDFPHMIHSLMKRDLERNRISVEDAEILVRENLGKWSRRLEVNFSEGDSGRVATFDIRDEYLAARLLLPNLHEMLSPKLGRDFYVGIPARDSFVAFSGDGNFVLDQRKKIASDYNNLPYPITPELFVVTRDGIAGTLDDIGEDY